jgi:hypothetical protein
MLTVKVLGSGCSNCVQVEDVARKVVSSLGLDVEIMKVTDYGEIVRYNILAEVVPVREIDYRRIGDGQPGPISRELQQLFYATAHGRTERSRTWLDYMAVAAIV